MSTWLTHLDATKSGVLVLSAVLRRQGFLVRALGGNSENCFVKMNALEADALNIITRITPKLDSSRHKGQAGKIAVVGGCREYTGAPYFAAISALKIGADLSHVFCTKDAAPIIKSYSPELIVHPVLEESYSVKDENKGFTANKVLSEVKKWMERFDCLVVGPGLGRDPFLLECVGEIIKHARHLNIPLVIDGDGLFLVTNNLDLISGYTMAVLSPNINEYKRLVQKVLNCEVDEEESSAQIRSLAKGVAVFLSWASRYNLLAENKQSSRAINPTIMGCVAGSALLRKAASLAFENKKRSTLTGDIIECLGQSLEDICPV
ncbi:ATP-dependent (S)-NAD(P)H-hydrate dehydratase isoform X2 [Amaranthus tricolor]|uniref:ATP-dependent (S)-NAD(P)H-hydrate dehydratase isoform X2 n=1 Tax=Amaranthus tricolor TaxID=29722 RepID=UPI00258A817E|nr:ATP-dependent (S)-NAD(P)H-hydrate dehydratase isoform X2 [Amaranthus tricolor]